MKKNLDFLLVGNDGSTATVSVKVSQKIMRKIAKECPKCTKIAFITNKVIENGKTYIADICTFFGPEFISIKNRNDSLRFILNVPLGEANYDHFYECMNTSAA
ncbi:TPA: hypothetical protein DEP21_00840 [Patescibacteria group bacterium]|nr:hypothetical protein [Candidatus Gracilibacteria bacterium]